MTQNAVRVQMTLNNFSSGSSQLQISGGTNFTISIVDIFGISVDASASHTAYRAIPRRDIKYPGVTIVACPPSPLTADNKTG